MPYKNRFHICTCVIRLVPFSSIAFLFLEIVAGVLLPVHAFALQKLIDAVVFAYRHNESPATFFIPLAGVTGIYLFHAVYEPIKSWCSFLIGKRLNRFFDEIIAGKLQMLDYTHLENSRNLDVIRRVEETSGNAAVDLFINTCRLLSGMIKITGSVALLMRYHYIIAILVTLISIPIFFISAKYGKTIHEWFQINTKKRRMRDYLSSIFTDKTAAAEMRVYGYFPYLHGKWKSVSGSLRAADLKIQLQAWKNTVISSFLLHIFEYTVYAVLLLPAFYGFMTIGIFVGLSKAVSAIEDIILWEFSSLFTFFARNKEYWLEYNTFLQYREIQKGSFSQERRSSRITGIKHIAFKDVCFTYANMSAPVLNGVNFEITGGQMCSLVGMNGAGKSTIIKLLLGLYQPDKGAIYINGINTNSMDFYDRMRFFSIIFQDFAKYCIPLKDSIMLSNIQDYNEDRILSLLQNLNFDYQKLPDRLDTVMGSLFKNGVDVSGGEWQKIALARMLNRNAECLILDEPAASLDPISEVRLYNHIKPMLSGKTSLLVTHRLAATTFCDNIMVLSDGKIIESGSFNELIKQGGLYARMYMQQKRRYQS